jgi:hypothetical protein
MNTAFKRLIFYYGIIKTFCFVYFLIFDISNWLNYLFPVMSQRNVSDVSATPSGIKRDWYVWDQLRITKMDVSSGMYVLLK